MTTPDQVTGVVVSETAGVVHLAWDAVSGADHYNVYRGTAPGAEVPSWATDGAPTGDGDTTGTLLAGQTYYYQVAAVAGDGTVGPMSAEVSITYAAGPPPAPHVTPIADTIVNADGSVPVGAVTAQLVSSSALLKDANLGVIVDVEPVSANLDATGAFTLGVIAPGDLQDALTNDAPTSCFYLLTLPDGTTLRTNVFNGSETPYTLAQIVITGTEVSYPTAEVRVQVVRPDDAPAVGIDVGAYLSTDGQIAGALVRAGDRFSLTLDATGAGSLHLPPNDQITPANTFYWVDLGAAARYAIVVPSAGGDLLDLFTAPLPAGTLAPALVSVGVSGSRPASAAEGAAYFATDTQHLSIWAAGAWVDVVGA